MKYTHENIFSVVKCDNLRSGSFLFQASWVQRKKIRFEVLLSQALLIFQKKLKTWNLELISPRFSEKKLSN